MDDQSLTNRLISASKGLSVSEVAQAAHMAEITEALEGAPLVALADQRSGRTRRLVAAIVAAAMIGPTGLAAASNSALPGEVLYTVKTVSERVTVLFDSDVVARHRVEELEAITIEGRNDPALASNARSAVAELPQDHPLRDRLLAVDSDANDDSHSDDDAPLATKTVELPDGNIVTVAIALGVIRDVEAPDPWFLESIEERIARLRNGPVGLLLRLEGDGTISVDLLAVPDEPLGPADDEDSSSEDDEAPDAPADDETPLDDDTDHDEGSGDDGSRDDGSDD